MIHQKETVNEIDISNILGKVTIQPHEHRDIIIDTTQEEKVAVTCKNGALFIQTKRDEKESKGKGGIFSKIFGGVTIHSTNSTVIIGNGNVIVNGLDASELVTVDMTIFVPKDVIKEIDVSTPIELTVLPISPKLTIDISGQTTTTVNGVEHVKLDGSGQSTIVISGANKVNADLSGQVQLLIESKVMKKVKLDTSGMTKVQIKSAEIDEVDFDVSGMGHILVQGKVGKKKIDKSGMTKIEFLNEEN